MNTPHLANEFAMDLATIIGVAIAPVFMLTGIASFLNVMTTRLGRTIDRVRILERRIQLKPEELQNTKIISELRLLWRRITLNQWAIGLCTASALFICVLTMSLFGGYVFERNISVLIIGFFCIALLCLIAALGLYLLEIRYATRAFNTGRMIYDPRAKHRDGSQ